MSSDPAAWFAETYAEADRRFVAAAGARPFETHAHPATGPAGETLATRVLRLGPMPARRVVFLQAGTHGTEARAAGGLLTGMLTSGPPALPSDTALVMIHAINPWGAAWDRYVNEDNADLMKNFLYGDTPAETDPLFAAFDDMLDIPSLGAPGALERLATRRQAFEATHGAGRLLACLKAGQAIRPDSIIYYGQRRSWSKRLLDDIVARHGAGAERILFVDLHTGLGDWGGASTVGVGPGASPERVRAWMGGDVIESDLVLARPLYGFVADLCPGAEVTAGYIEGGTERWGWEMREVMLMEMFHHLHGDRTSAEASAVRARFRAFYHPPGADWARAYWASNSAAIGRLISGFTA
ncbi:MAG: DUF2817 domain-containing protein [Alphaproteobacteria bacterium]|nr:DUF2817 domain-containing protein [Alphaproteobacteria bacterium]